MESDQEKNVSVVRKIITFKEPDDIQLFKKNIEISGGKIIKKLPLVDGYLCEFPDDSTVSLTMRGYSDRLKLEDDLTFKLCWFPWPYFFSPYNEPEKPSTTPDKEKPFPDGRVGWGLKRIGAPEVWEKLTGRRIRVGIIDTGIDYNHPDLKANIKDGVSTLDGVDQYMDDYGHGTHVAGIIGSLGVIDGLTGINPHVDFYVVKAFDKKGKGSLSDIIEGLDWLYRRQVNVINMSFSTSETNETFARAISYIYERGITMVAAAGNDGQRNSVNYPARFPQVFAVSATDRYDRIANFSSTGPEIDFCAPGVAIPSTWVGGGYLEKSGTSFAAPHVTGTVADIINYMGTLPPTKIREIMMSKGAVKISGLDNEQQGAGMVEIPRVIK